MNNERGEWTSASNAEADELCPGRHLMQRGLPEEKSEDAEFGTQLHAALAKGSDDGLTVEQKDLYESCERILLKVVEYWFGDTMAADAVHLQEKRLWQEYAGEGGRVYRHSGQIDRAIIALTTKTARAMLIEWKSLAGEVATSPRNMQLRDQAVLLWHNYIDPDIEDCEIATVVVQPYVTHSPEICVYNRAELEQASTAMLNRVVISNYPESPRRPGEIQCKFCRARSKCPEYGSWAGSQSPLAVTAPGLIRVPVAQWTPEMRAEFCNRRAIAQKWMDDTEAEMKRLLEADPNSIPGWQLQKGHTRRTVTDPQSLFDRFAGLGGTLEQFMTCVGVGKEKLEQAVHAATGLKGVELRKAIERLLDGMTSEKPISPSLKRSDESE